MTVLHAADSSLTLEAPRGAGSDDRSPSAYPPTKTATSTTRARRPATTQRTSTVLGRLAGSTGGGGGGAGGTIGGRAASPPDDSMSRSSPPVTACAVRLSSLRAPPSATQVVQLSPSQYRSSWRTVR